jgi:integration host factor subunit beta
VQRNAIVKSENFCQLDVPEPEPLGRMASEKGRALAKNNRRALHMIRSELIKKLEDENPELKTEEIEKIVDLFFNQIIQRLSDGGRVELRGFGAFSTRDRSPRKGRNPRTGASVEVPSKRVPYFKPGKEVREQLNK